MPPDLDGLPTEAKVHATLPDDRCWMLNTRADEGLKGRSLPPVLLESISLLL